VESKENVFRLEVVTPNKIIFKGDAKSLVVSSVKGSMGVLPKHAPLLAVLKPGNISFVCSEESYAYTSSEGFIEVMPDRVRILVESVKEK